MASRWISSIPTHGFYALATLLLACSSEPAAPVDTGKQASIEYFEATPSSLAAAGTVELSWRTANAVSLELTRDGEALALGDAPIGEGWIELQVEETSTFELLARGSAGVPAIRSVQVKVAAVQGDAPAIATFVGPEEVGRNEEGNALAELAWTGVVGADELVIQVDGLEPIEIPTSETPDGGIEIELIADATISLVAKNTWGETSRQVEVRVLEFPVIKSLTTDRDWVGSSDPLLVEWETAGAARVELLVNGTPFELLDSTSTTGSADVFLGFDSIIELRAFNDLGQFASDEVAVKVGVPMVEIFQGSATGLWIDDTLNLSWRTQGGNSLQVAVEGTNEVICVAANLAQVGESSCSWKPAAGSYFLVLTVENGSGVASGRWSVQVGSGPAIESFTVTPSELSLGEEVVVSWVARPDPLGQEPALQLADDQGGEYEIAGTSGSQSFVFDQGVGTFEFTLTATTDDPKSVAATASASITVHAMPTVTLEASSSIFDEGEVDDVVIEWTSQYATNLILSQTTSAGSRVIEVIPEERRAAGSYRFVPETELTTFRIDARNTLGDLVFAVAEVTLAPPQVVKFTSTASFFDLGDPVELEWETRMTSDLEISIFKGAYVVGETKGAFVDAAENGGTHLPLSSSCNPALLTQGCAVLGFPDGFSFFFGGESFTSARVFSNGFINFGAIGTGSSSNNQGLPTQAPYQHVHLAPFWDELTWDEARFPQGNIHYLLQGTPGERSLVIQWKEATLSLYRGARLNFEVILHENGDFDFRYGDMDPGVGAPPLAITQAEGSSATIGYQLRDRSSSHMRQHNTNLSVWGTLIGRSFNYTPTPVVGKRGTFTWHPYPTAANMEIKIIASRGELRDEESLSFTAYTRPELRFLAPKEPVEEGTPFLIGWKTANASKVEVRDQANVLICETSVPTEVEEGSCAQTQAVGGMYTYSVRALDSRGFGIEKFVQAAVYEPFGIDSLSVDKESVTAGEEVSVSWVTYNASTISLKANGSELLTESATASGNQVHKVTAKTTFVLRVENEFGVFRERTVSVDIRTGTP